jgi:hypothetical protein
LSCTAIAPLDFSVHAFPLHVSIKQQHTAADTDAAHGSNASLVTAKSRHVSKNFDWNFVGRASSNLRSDGAPSPTSCHCAFLASSVHYYPASTPTDKETAMKLQSEEMRQRLGFIDRTIIHAVRACTENASVPEEMRLWVNQMEKRCCQAWRALQASDEHRVRENMDDLARLSYHAQNAIHLTDGMAYELKSAVILAHIELSALRYQLD